MGQNILVLQFPNTQPCIGSLYCRLRYVHSCAQYIRWIPPIPRTHIFRELFASKTVVPFMQVLTFVVKVTLLIRADLRLCGLDALTTKQVRSKSILVGPWSCMIVQATKGAGKYFEQVDMTRTNSNLATTKPLVSDVIIIQPS